MADCFTLLRRITRLKCKFRDKVEGSNILPRQVFPEGLTASCRTDVSNTHAQNCDFKFCCGMHLTCKNIAIKPDRNGSVKGPEKVSRSNDRHSQCGCLKKIEVDENQIAKTVHQAI